MYVVQLRHPNILAFKDTTELEERGETVIYLVTEPVTPLPEVLSSLEMDGPQRSQYVAMGLYHVAKAVSFLNNDCNLVRALCINSSVRS
jgi:SCY1-like protein 1